MQNWNHAHLMIIGGIGLALLLSGCPKKVETAKPGEKPAVKEEKVQPPAEAAAPKAETTPSIAEAPVMKEADAASKALNDVYFEYDKSAIRDDARASLEQAARWLNDHPAVQVKIEGHCDERGTNEYNLSLGERRAKAVKEFLAAMGVSKSRLSTLSYGEERPVCTAQTEDCYGKNRRAHFVAQ